jgi:hypothetical protein
MCCNVLLWGDVNKDLVIECEVLMCLCLIDVRVQVLLLIYIVSETDKVPSSHQHPLRL